MKEFPMSSYLPPLVRDYALDPGQEGEPSARTLLLWYHHTPGPRARVGISARINELAPFLGDALQVAFDNDEVRITSPDGPLNQEGTWPIQVLRTLGVETDGDIPVRATSQSALRGRSQKAKPRLVTPGNSTLN